MSKHVKAVALIAMVDAMAGPCPECGGGVMEAATCKREGCPRNPPNVDESTEEEE